MLSILLLLGLIANAFLFTLSPILSCYNRVDCIFLLQASSVFNLMILPSHIPGQAVPSFTEEWIYDDSMEQISNACQVIGFFIGLSGNSAMRGC